MAAVPSIGRARGVSAHPAPEADATRALYERYSDQIFGYCLHQLGSREEAEDAVQSTFLNAFRGLSRGVVPEMEQAWLFKIAHNVCLSRRRSSWRRGRIESPADFEIAEQTTPSPSRRRDELIGLQDVLEGMPENQRRAILLREWQGLSYREIAAELEMSQAAVETLIFRARRALAAGLESSPQEQRSRRSRLRPSLSLGNLATAIKSLLGAGVGAKAVGAAALLTVASAGVVGTTELIRPTAGSGHAPPAAAPLARTPEATALSTGLLGFGLDAAANRFAGLQAGESGAATGIVGVATPRVAHGVTAPAAGGARAGAGQGAAAGTVGGGQAAAGQAGAGSTEAASAGTASAGAASAGAAGRSQAHPSDRLNASGQAGGSGQGNAYGRQAGAQGRANGQSYGQAGRPGAHGKASGQGGGNGPGNAVAAAGTNDAAGNHGAASAQSAAKGQGSGQGTAAGGSTPTQPASAGAPGPPGGGSPGHPDAAQPQGAGDSAAAAPPAAGGGAGAPGGGNGQAGGSAAAQPDAAGQGNAGGQGTGASQGNAAGQHGS